MRVYSVALGRRVRRFTRVLYATVAAFGACGILTRILTSRVVHLAALMAVGLLLASIGADRKGRI